MASLELRLLGGIQLQQNEGPPVGLTSKKGQALLCYLAMAGRPLDRSRLAGLLWPDVSEGVAQANLRKVISRLRPSLSPYLSIHYGTLAFNHDSDWWLDVVEFQERVAHKSDIDQLAQAVDLYQGDFMDGFDTRDAPLFDEWVLAQRTRLREAAVAAWRTLITQSHAAGRYEPAVAYARQLLAQEPWHEETHRDLMRALALSGQRGAALAHYEVCRRVLADELGIAPAAETLALYDHIRAGTLAVPARIESTFSPKTPAAGRPAFQVNDSGSSFREKSPFVGRHTELTRLHRHLSLALAGQGQVALLTGEAGSGKTALAQAFARQAGGQWPELVVVTGICNAITGLGDPYHPFRAITAQLAGDIGTASARALDHEQARRLWELLPHATESLLEAGSDLWDTFVPLDAHLARARTHERASEPWIRRLEAVAVERLPPRAGVVRQQRLFEQYAEFLRLLARHAPLVLILDDLQWADAGTISLLYHLSRHLTVWRIMILGAFRPADIAVGRDGERHPLLPVVSELRRRFGDIVLDLEATDGQQFVEAFLDTQPNRLTTTFREAFFQLTRGHPMFTVELWRDLQERGDVIRNDAGEWAALPGLTWRHLPARVEAVIGERIHRLPLTAQDILRVASVEGECFTAEVVARVLGIDERTTFAQLRHDLDEAHSLVQVESVRHSDAGRLSRYKFRHSLIRNYLYDHLGAGERIYLHELVGRELEALNGAESGDIAVELAQHFRQAGSAGKAAAYLQLAGERAFRRSANREAIALYGEALALLEILPDGPEKVRRELTTQMSLGAALMSSADAMTEVERVYTRALALARMLEDPQAINPTLIGLWLCNILSASFGRAYAVAEELLALAADAGDEAIGLGGHYAAGISLFFMGDFGPASEHLQTAIRLYDPARHRHLTHYFSYDPGTMAYQYAALTSWFMGHAERAIVLSAEGLRLAREHANPFNLVNNLNYVAILFQYLGEPQSILSINEEALALAARYDFPHLYAMALYCRGWGLFYTGQVEKGLEFLNQGLVKWLSSGARLALTHYYQTLGEAYLIAGDDQQAWEALEKGFGSVESGQFWEVELHRLRCELLIHRGAAAIEIEGSFQRALDIARRQQAKALVLRATISQCHWYEQTGRRAEAHHRLEAVYLTFIEGFDTPDLKQAKALLDSLSQLAPG